MTTKLKKHKSSNCPTCRSELHIKNCPSCGRSCWCYKGKELKRKLKDIPIAKIHEAVKFYVLQHQLSKDGQAGQNIQLINHITFLLTRGQHGAYSVHLMDDRDM